MVHIKPFILNLAPIVAPLASLYDVSLTRYLPGTIFPVRNMRQFSSITAIVALISALLTPQFSMECCVGGGRQVCHRAAERHCDHMDQVQSDEQPSTNISARTVPSKCPMTCCLSVAPNAGTTVVLIAINLPQVITQVAVGSNLVFISSGFSSHTDRGPPLA